MKIVEWTDEQGYNRRRLVHDNDGIEQAKFGIPQEPPDVDRIDWEAVKVDLHNLLLAHGVTTFEVASKSNSPLAAVLIKTLKRHVLQLFKEDRNGNL